MIENQPWQDALAFLYDGADGCGQLLLPPTEGRRLGGAYRVPEAVNRDENGQKLVSFVFSGYVFL